jgi:proline racemase
MEAMRFRRAINVAGVHAEGELNEVITAGALDVPGKTKFDKMQWLESKGHDLRQFLLHEPRGKVTQCVNLVLPSTRPDADVGFVIMESEYYVPMPGTNMIRTVTALLETGMIAMQEPVTQLTLDAPGGLVRFSAACKDGKCESVTFNNMPSFVFTLDRNVEIAGIGTVTCDVAYGGMIYAMTDATKLGFKIEPSEARDLVDLGEKIKRAAAEQISAVHPENPQSIPSINCFGPRRWSRPAARRVRNAVIASPGRIDRSPCGTRPTHCRPAIDSATRGRTTLKPLSAKESPCLPRPPRISTPPLPRSNSKRAPSSMESTLSRNPERPSKL